jgi:hypothetical protein
VQLHKIAKQVCTLSRFAAIEVAPPSLVPLALGAITTMKWFMASVIWDAYELSIWKEINLLHPKQKLA